MVSLSGARNNDGGNAGGDYGGGQKVYIANKSLDRECEDRNSISQSVSTVC